MDSVDRDCIILYWLGLITCLTIGIVYILGRAGVIPETKVKQFVQTYIVITFVTVTVGLIGLSTLV